MTCMRTIERTHQLKRDYRREAKGQYRKILDDVLMPVVADLAADQSLARYYSDHPLSGNWKGCRNCHIRPDRSSALIGDTYL